MNLHFLRFLAQPALVITWYAFGAIAAVLVLRDTFTANRQVTPALKAAWPIIVLFFSVIGVALYVWSCRPTRIGSLQNSATEDDGGDTHRQFVAEKWKKVVGSAIHCVGGDGVAIVSAMVITRLRGFSFWREFWTEYAVGFAFGWILLQTPAMHQMGHSWLTSLWKGGRAEFFSMITVMVGMGMVMRFLTPIIIGDAPQPDTAAFWGIASLGLLVGFIFTYPMNWWLVKIGWKHGMT